MIIVLAGPPAVGHNTVAELLCVGRPRAAIVDGDILRAMSVSPSVMPGAGREWDRQYELCVRNLCAVALNFDSDGALVVVLDVVEPEVLPLFRQLLSGVDHVVILLTAAVDVLISRDLNRDTGPQADPAAILSWHGRIRHLQERLTAHADHYDVVIDNSHLSAQETADRTQASSLLSPR